MVDNPAGTESRCFGWQWLAGIASGSVGYLITTTPLLPAEDFGARFSSYLAAMTRFQGVRPGGRWTGLNNGRQRGGIPRVGVSLVTWKALSSAKTFND